MRIALIGPANPYRGGIAKFFDTLAENMHRSGDEILLINFYLQYPSFLFPGKTQYTAKTEVPYRTERILSSVNPLSWIKAARTIRQFHPDLVLFRYWMPFMAPCLGSIAALLRPFHKVAITDNILPHERHFFDGFLTRYFTRRIDRIVCMSKKVEEELLALGYNGKVVFHHHPVYNSYGAKVERETACQKLSLDSGKKYAMFFGFIREYKGLDILLRAWQKVKTEDLTLIVAGEFYSDPSAYLALAEALSDRVILRTEYIPEEDVNLYFSAADLVIQPYRTASQSGITGIAYNYLVPMVVTDVGGLKESVTDGEEGFVVKPEENDIAKAVDRYFSEGRKEQFALNMQKRMGDFSWEGMIGCIEKLD